MSSDAVQKICQELGGVEHIETSAKDNTNVTDAFSGLASKALDRMGSMQKRADETGGGRRSSEKERLRNARRSNRTMDSFTTHDDPSSHRLQEGTRKRGAEKKKCC